MAGGARGASGDFDLQRRAEEVPVAEYLALVQAVIAALSHIAVSKALLIIGMFMPKLALAALLAAGLPATFWVVSVARSP